MAASGMQLVRCAWKRQVGRPVFRSLQRYRSSSTQDVPLGSSGKAQSSPVDASSVPLSQPLPGIPTPIYATVKAEQGETQVTTLENGLRVASEKRFGQFCTVGVVVDSGSRYEVAYPSGISHFLEKLAFGATKEYSSRDKILQELEKHGGICDCQCSRDTLIYAASADSRGLDTIVKIIGEAALRPLITPEELEGTRMAVKFEMEDMDLRPDQEPLLMEMIHAAAYQDNTLGLPKICPSENVDQIDQQMIYTYLKHHFTPSRMVLAGVGIEHDALVESAQKYFVQTHPTWETHSQPLQNMAVDSSVAQYTGGLVQLEKDLSNVQPGPSPLPELAHLVVGLESTSHQDSDFVATCILNVLMGGGGSFSAGGPGKGMYTRLYTNVLNRFHWMYNATAYNHSYADTGVFCIHASAPPARLGDLVEIVVRELVAMAGAVGDVELQRAKKQLQSMLLMNLESRAVVFEDIGRQVLVTGHRKRPEHFMQQIEMVTTEDIHRVVLRMLRTKPSVAALGDLKRLPNYSDIETGLLDCEGRMPRNRKFTLFR